MSQVDLELQNFPGPLALRISNYIPLTPDATIFTEIVGVSLEIFHLTKFFEQICQAPSETRFAPATIVLLYENGESPSLQAMCYPFRGGEVPFHVLSPRQRRKILPYNQFSLNEFKNFGHFPDLGVGRSRATSFPRPLAFSILNYIPSTPDATNFTKIDRELTKLWTINQNFLRNMLGSI